MKKIFVAIFILLNTGLAFAQSDQEIMYHLQMAAQTVRSNYQTSVSEIDIYQMANDAQGYQRAVYEKSLHEEVFACLERVAANPSQLRNPQVYNQLDIYLHEYNYRFSSKDYRPYDQIQGNLQQWIAQRSWEASTAEGQQAYNNRQQQAWNNFNAQQSRVNQANANFDNYMNGLQSAQTQREKDHHQYVNTIHDQYEYVNPNNGQSYMYPNTQSQYPVVENQNGSYTQLVPYQQY
jgi:hypothetical protein